jgi:DNA-binding transcriptional ArsR family regulator
MTATDIFRTLADPTRRAIFERLADAALSGGELSVSALKAGLPVSQPAVSQHLAALRGAGLVAERRDGRHAFYRVEPQGLAPLVDWTLRYRAFWPERIERLKTVLQRMDP